MLTGRQQAIFDFILQFRKENGCSPSIPEIQRAFRIRSPNGVAGHLRALLKKGVLRRANRGSRQLDPVEPEGAGPIISLPLLGPIAAGMPDLVPPASAGGIVRIDELTLGFDPKPGTFALRVRGDSMKDAGILEGDLVVVEPTPAPAANQVVAALIDGECTLKRLVRVKGRWFLKAENAAYPELHPRSDLVIQGVVRAVIRRLA
ncbi:MAG: repressor LexA [Acidimicrobiia bacterium]|nr:repressor LexA [Acidimicrobiia bacterium]